MAQCAPQIKKVSLELGGLAPFILFDSANLEKAMTDIKAFKFRCAGQTCVTPQNFMFQEGERIQINSFILITCKNGLSYKIACIKVSTFTILVIKRSIIN